MSVPNRGRVYSDFPVTRVKNAQVLIQDPFDMKYKFVRKDLCFQNGLIINDQELFYKLSTKSTDVSGLREDTIDAKGGYIVPGFIDIQINGGGGVDFSDPKLTEEDVRKVGRLIVSHGCTSYCPTVVTSSPETYQKVLPLLGPKQDRDLPEILGCHTEGPFINKKKKGAHEEDFIKNPGSCIPNGGNILDGIKSVYGNDLTNIKWITLAPELLGSQDAIIELVKLGKIVSCGHTEASIEDMEAAISNGATLITHLFNAMTSFDHRGPGVIGVLGSPEEMRNKIMYGIIADGIHSHPYSLNLANNTHGNGIILITDAIAALALPIGKYLLGTKQVVIKKHTLLNGKESKKAVLEENGSTLAGSIVSMIDCVNNMIEFTHCTLAEAAIAASYHPAIAMRVDNRKGLLIDGYDADFIILQPDSIEKNRYNINKVFVRGVEAYRSSQ